MISTDFQGTPRVVWESRHRRSSVYWLRTNEGNYEPVTPRSFRMNAAASFGREQLKAVQLEAVENHMQVRCVGGLKPGVYGENGAVFLNPEFVPLVNPVTPKPPEEFQAVFSKCIALQKKDDTRNKKEVDRLRKRLLEIYLECRNAKEVAARSKYHPWTLLGKGNRHEDFPSDDHCNLFKTSNSYIWTSQPYGIELPQILGFARLHGLKVQISREWSWYYPGHSVLIEWTHDCGKRPLSDAR